MILFVIALPQELKIVKSELKSTNFENTKLDFLLNWVWNFNTIYSMKDYICKNGKPDFIVNIWVCWKINDNFNDFFQVSRIKYLSNNKEVINPIYIKAHTLKSILCSDKIITEKSQMIDEDFVDMESYWVSYICEKEAIPYLILKKPFDIVSNDSKKVSLIDLENCLKWFDFKNLINNINIYLKKSSKFSTFDNEIIYLKEKFRLTFSETDILKKYINKEIAFWKNINEILENLNTKEKKDFLILIKLVNFKTMLNK